MTRRRDKEGGGLEVYKVNSPEESRGMRVWKRSEKVNAGRLKWVSFS